MIKVVTVSFSSYTKRTLNITDHSSHNKCYILISPILINGIITLHIIRFSLFKRSFSSPDSVCHYITFCIKCVGHTINTIATILSWRHSS